VNEGFLIGAYVTYCTTLLAIRHSGEWREWADTWDEYVRDRWSLSKSRAKLLCSFAAFRLLCEKKEVRRLPDTPEQCKPLLALPKKQWLETWELVVDTADGPINAQHVESTMRRFRIFARKGIPPDVQAGIRVRRAAKTMAEFGDGERLVETVGERGLGNDWKDAVRVTIDADQARMNGKGDK
jgi:hypothetical protein